MPISLNDDCALLEGYIDITDVDILHPWLQQNPTSAVDVSDCTGAHTAVVQLLIATGATVAGAEGTEDWRQYLTSGREYYAKENA